MMKPNFIPVRALPAPLRLACNSYAPKAYERRYDADWGRCFEATDQFVRHVYEMSILPGIDVRRSMFKFCLDEHVFVDDATKVREERPYREHEKWQLSTRARRHRDLIPYPLNGAYYHWVATMMGFAIDWTSSQFGKFPFPTIWRLEELPLW